jgi:hypothetical protein
MLAYLRKSEARCRIVLVEKTDRLYRNFKDYVTLDELDLELHLVKENVVLSRDSRSSEKFIHGIKVLMAKNYIDNLSEETRKGMLEKAEQGIWPSYAPIGYSNADDAQGRKVIVPDPELAPMVVRLFELYAEGGRSLRELGDLVGSERLNRRNPGKPLCTATVQKILSNRIYSGEFEWGGRLYQGVYEPLISKDLWNRVQTARVTRLASRCKKVQHGFPFSGLVKCGHCGCALVGELKKGKYVYYHCTGFKGKCPEPYTRQEVLEQEFGRLLKKLQVDDEILGWLAEALRESHADEKKFHEEAIARINADYQRLPNRLETLYEDRLDGRIEVQFYDRKARDLRAEQSVLRQSLEQHQNGNRAYMEEGLRLLELSGRMHDLFDQQPPEEKRRLLNFALSNCSWKEGRLEAEFRQPFNMLVVANEAQEVRMAESGAKTGVIEDWLPGKRISKRFL